MMMKTNRMTPSSSGIRMSMRRISILAITATVCLPSGGTEQRDTQRGSAALGLQKVDARISLRPDSGDLLGVPGRHQLGVYDRVEHGLLGDDVQVLVHEFQLLGRAGFLGGRVHQREEVLGLCTGVPLGVLHPGATGGV